MVFEVLRSTKDLVEDVEDVFALGLSAALLVEIDLAVAGGEVGDADGVDVALEYVSIE